MQFIWFSVVFSLVVTLCTAGPDYKPEYKMCVPHSIFDACVDLVSNKESEFAKILCVSARDRMECLEKVNKREADFLAVDPEDMYVAFHMDNEDFSVFSEIRTIEEPEADFRYEGVMLVHKGSNIKSLNNLRGKKSCHTGYGRNVGYKIPITKLRKHGILQLSTDPTLTSTEKELKALSELFTQSCLVGNYSSNDDLNRALKKRYSQLCSLCEEPFKCNYPDKYSGYDGAIRCLIEKGGDVAFTKVIYVRRYFGLPINNVPSKTAAQANPDDYEYLCEDGSRRAVTDNACSWAQRPWQGFMGNSGIRTRLNRLQDRINEFYNDGKKSSDKQKASKLWINEKNVVVKKENHAMPGDHLVQAQYKDVIERDGSTDQKIRLCVSSDTELRKCEVMKKAAYSRDIRPTFACVVNSDCIHSILTNDSDVAVLAFRDQERAKENLLMPIVFEEYDSHYVIVAKRYLSKDILALAPIQYNGNDSRSYHAALHFNFRRGNVKCSALTTDYSSIRVLKVHGDEDKAKQMISGTEELICKSFDSSRPNPVALLADDCIYDATPPTAIFVRSSIGERERDGIEHAFSTLSNKFGKGSQLEDVFELFGEFEPGKKDVIFSDDAKTFSQNLPNYAADDHHSLYNKIQCHP